MSKTFTERAREYGEEVIGDESIIVDWDHLAPILAEADACLRFVRACGKSEFTPYEPMYASETYAAWDAIPNHLKENDNE